MEVGIDIGSSPAFHAQICRLPGQITSSRAGREVDEESAVATVTAFGSADSHDEHYFTHPDQMIRGAVDDPILTLDNPEIARRHVTAYLLQRYHQAKLPAIKPEDQPHLFAVLGTVSDSKDSKKVLNRLIWSVVTFEEIELKTDVAACFQEKWLSCRQIILNELIRRDLCARSMMR
jgi:hypothetical protein